ncbi:hypothetical protein BST61_g77 [Cercospora zeina]
METRVVHYAESRSTTIHSTQARRQGARKKKDIITSPPSDPAFNTLINSAAFSLLLLLLLFTPFFSFPLPYYTLTNNPIHETNNQQATMASHLRLPTLLLTTLSMLLSLTILITASYSLSTFNTNRTENVYFLPVWGSSHLDLRSLSALIGTAVIILLLNFLLVAAMFIPNLPTNALVLLSTLLSTILSLIALAFPASLNTSSSPSSSSQKATLQSYVCNWRKIPHQGVPDSFDAMCHETRLAFYTTIPLFALQLLLLSIAFYALTTRGANEAMKRRRSVMRLDEEEKHGSGQQDYEMASSQQQQRSGGDQKRGKVRVVEVGGKQ